jgi:hypothetical protein
MRFIPGLLLGFPVLGQVTLGLGLSGTAREGLPARGLEPYQDGAIGRVAQGGVG